MGSDFARGAQHKLLCTPPFSPPLHRHQRPTLSREGEHPSCHYLPPARVPGVRGRSSPLPARASSPASHALQDNHFVAKRPISPPPTPHRDGHRLDLVCRCQLTTHLASFATCSPRSVLTTAFYLPNSSCNTQISRATDLQIAPQPGCLLQRCWCTPSLPQPTLPCQPQPTHLRKGGAPALQLPAPARHHAVTSSRLPAHAFEPC